ncbi:MAG: hypothetical protein Q8L77_10215 [Nitrospirota bacterium]|nr:hypothetical protein [Nitrospirota bacterium]
MLTLLTTACGFSAAYKQAVADLEEIERKNEEKKRELQRPIREGETIPFPVAHQLLQGTLKGSACKGRVSVEVTLTEPSVYGVKGSFLEVLGSFRSVDRAKGSAVPVVDTQLKGLFHLNGGFLVMQSIPKPSDPLTGTAAIAEGWTRGGESAKYRALQSKYDAEWMKHVMEVAKAAPEQRERLMKESSEKLRELTAEIEQLRTQQAQRLQKQKEEADAAAAAAKAALIPLQLDVARDLEGKGWAGSFQGQGFGDCDDIVLASDRGRVTVQLPPITAQAAMRRATPDRNITPSTGSRIYWLTVALKQGDDDALFPLGQLYEQRGASAPDNYARALGYYQTAADKHGDARAQVALSRMYAEGVGTAKNPAEAQRWRQLATETYQAANEACTSKQAYVALMAVVRAEQGKVANVEGLVKGVTGIRVNSGRIVLIRSMAAEVVSLDKPFVCRVAGKRIDPSADASSVPDYFEVTHANGDITLESNAGEKAVKGLIASMTENFAKNMPYLDQFKIETLGALRYKVSSNILNPPHSEIVDLR